MSNTSLLGSYGGLGNSGLQFRNKLINGNFDIWQRSTSAANNSYSNGGGYGSADRWKYIGYAVGASYLYATLSRITDAPPGSQFAAKLSSNNSEIDSIGVGQIIESANTYDLVGKPATLTLWLKKFSPPAGSTLTIDISYLDVENTAPTYISSKVSEPAGGVFGGATIVASLDISVDTMATTWTKYTLTTPSLPQGAANGMFVRAYISKQGAQNMGILDFFAIAQVQLEAGPVATPFEHRPIGLELSLCHRYYRQYSASIDIATGYYNSTTEISIPVPFAVPMRAAPTLLFSQLSDFDLEPFDVQPTSISIYSPLNGPGGSTLLAYDPVARTIGFAGALRIDTAGGWLAFDAEL